ncbi:hypothetical protein C1C98_08065 [Pseudomonas ogarae]|uniref:Uncharacterized protein n=1 Tax=Pseudomonas ogarae (strain DSM 112162 / CECT 30235 / F113) TaxID=1114970 RepID=A0ABM6QY19_PSEO1|nr:hypothetical protein C1C98_08065 [Pseudomonas ogarae]
MQRGLLTGGASGWDAQHIASVATSPVGASLLAIAVGHFEKVLDVPPSSRASSLPHLICGALHLCPPRPSRGKYATRLAWALKKA